MGVCVRGGLIPRARCVWAYVRVKGEDGAGLAKALPPTHPL